MSGGPLGQPSRLDAATPKVSRGRPSPVAWACVGAVVVFANSVATTCPCGYMDGVSLVGNSLGTGAVCFGLLTQRAGLVCKLAIYVCFTFACTVMILNAHNILWSGHSPLLR